GGDQGRQGGRVRDRARGARPAAGRRGQERRAGDEPARAPAQGWREVSAATLVPAPVASLNTLLGERRRLVRGLRVPLGSSYAVHAALIAALLLLGRRAYVEFGTPSSPGTIDALPVYSVGAAPGPRAPVAPAPIPAPRPEVKPEPPVPEPPRPAA